MHGVFAHSTNRMQLLCKRVAALGDSGGIHIFAGLLSPAIATFSTPRGMGQQDIFFYANGELRPEKLQQGFYFQRQPSSCAPKDEITDKMQMGMQRCQLCRS